MITFDKIKSACKCERNILAKVLIPSFTKSLAFML